jgi:glycosyltransferase involved in cell wall biosynthesis
MISILIPVYNRDVQQLASTLSSQLQAIDTPGEIILLDDGSANEYRQANASTAGLPHIKYLESEKNLGRILVRQQLAEKAAYDWMLFIDCDSTIISSQYLQQYFNVISLGNYFPGQPGVIVGGRIYQQQPPGDCALRLHWDYGRKREAIDLKKRNDDPWRGFMSNNFLVHKTVFSQFSFINDWEGYGHEDSWIGIQLENKKVRVKYIDNPVLHDGLETADVFLRKSEEALKNLRKLQQLVDDTQLKSHIKLFRVYARLKQSGLLWLASAVYNWQKGKIEKNLKSCSPSLFYFDLYRLHHFIRLMRST